MSTPAEFAVGSRVRTRAVSSLAQVDHGKSGVVDALYPGTPHPIGVVLDDGTTPAFSADELEPEPGEGRAASEDMEWMDDQIEEGLRRGRRLEDLDHAARAVVDAADEWEAASPAGYSRTHQALTAAVRTWRAVRDGRAS